MPHLARPIAVLVTPRRDSRAPCPSPTPSANAACVFALRVPKSNGRAPQARTTQHAQSLMTSRPQAQQASPDHGQLAADAVSPPHSPFLLPLRSISLHVQLQRPVGRASMRTARLTTCMLVERPIASEHPAASGRDLPHPRRPLYRTRVCVCVHVPVITQLSLQGAAHEAASPHHRVQPEGASSDGSIRRSVSLTDSSSAGFVRSAAPRGKAKESAQQTTRPAPLLGGVAAERDGGGAPHATPQQPTTTRAAAACWWRRAPPWPPPEASRDFEPCAPSQWQPPPPGSHRLGSHLPGSHWPGLRWPWLHRRRRLWRLSASA